MSVNIDPLEEEGVDPIINSHPAAPSSDQSLHLRRQPANDLMCGTAERQDGSVAISVKFVRDLRRRHSDVRTMNCWRRRWLTSLVL